MYRAPLVTVFVKLRYFTEYVFFEAASLMFRILPHTVYSRLGSAIGAAAYKWFNLRRDIILVQLDAVRSAFQDRYSLHEADIIGQKVLENIGRAGAEFLARPNASFFQNNGMFEISGKEKLDQVNQDGLGGIIVTGHFGNWEWMGALAADAGINIAYLVADLHNPYISGAVNKTRKKWGIDVINQKTGLLNAIRRLEKGGVLAVLADQDAGKRGIFVPFFGMPASTTRLPAYLSCRTGAPILPVFMISYGKNYHIHIENPIYPGRNESIEQCSLKLTEGFTEVIEKYVREYPELWFWPHRRWKTTPPGGGATVSYTGLARKVTLKRRES